ncbi:MAG: hypothetical protein ACE3JK_16540 [Sporolactobacillus sp.]
MVLTDVDLPHINAEALVQPYDKNMVHGNTYTRTQWITYAVATIALSLLGTKGIDKMGKMVDVGKLAEKSGVVTRNTASAVADKMDGFHDLFAPKYQFAGGNVPYNTLDAKGIKDKLLRIMGNDREAGNISKKINKNSISLNDTIGDVKEASFGSVQEVHQKAKSDRVSILEDKQVEE